MLHTVLNQSLVWLNFGIGRGDIKQQDYPAKNICLKSLLSKNDDKKTPRLCHDVDKIKMLVMRTVSNFETQLKTSLATKI